MEILDQKARIALAGAEGMKSQEGFEAVVDEAATLRAHKVIEHGEQRFQKGKEPLNLLQTLFQIQKKSMRLNTVMERWIDNGLSKPGGGLDSLRDTMLDNSNYSLMGVQLLDQLVGKPRVPVHERVETAANIFLPFEQVAIQVEDIDQTIDFLGLLGLNDWSHDEVRARGYVGGKSETNVAHLAFNYQAGPFELELIQYVAGPNWLEDRYGQKAGLSHIGIHTDNMYLTYDLLMERFKGEIAIAQEVITETHYNPKIPANRHYWYVILATRHMFGFDLKLIQRLVRQTIPPVMLTNRS